MPLYGVPVQDISRRGLAWDMWCRMRMWSVLWGQRVVFLPSRWDRV